jgi:hypothetical protein
MPAAKADKLFIYQNVAKTTAVTATLHFLP